MHAKFLENILVILTLIVLVCYLIQFLVVSVFLLSCVPLSELLKSRIDDPAIAKYYIKIFKYLHCIWYFSVLFMTLSELSFSLLQKVSMILSLPYGWESVMKVCFPWKEETVHFVWAYILEIQSIEFPLKITTLSLERRNGGLCLSIQTRNSIYRIPPFLAENTIVENSDAQHMASQIDLYLLYVTFFYLSHTTLQLKLDNGFLQWFYIVFGDMFLFVTILR